MVQYTSSINHLLIATIPKLGLTLYGVLVVYLEKNIYVLHSSGRLTKLDVVCLFCSKVKLAVGYSDRFGKDGAKCLEQVGHKIQPL